MERYKQEARQLLDNVVEWRRALHQIPELEMDTVETEAYICARLDEMGIPYRNGIAGHGVAALIEGGRQGKVFALRADCDGLPIKEETGLSFASTNGRMHACGHDVHTAMALGAASLLMDHRDEICGTVKIIFQPGEEGCKTGPGGAKRMIDDGVLDNPSVDAILGLHTGMIWDEGLKPGQVAIRGGSVMACMDRFEILVKGKGSHGAYPHGSIDPISIATQIVSELQTIVSREVDPVEPAVISIGELHAGTAFNIIPAKCRILGTVRAITAETREFLARRIEEIATTTAHGMRGNVEFKYGWEGPAPVVNDPKFTDEFEEVAVKVLGRNNVVEIKSPSMGGEDFAFYLEKVPGTFFFHPSCNREKGQTYPHHNSRFMIDEDAMWVGPALFSAMAVEWLKDHAK